MTNRAPVLPCSPGYRAPVGLATSTVPYVRPFPGDRFTFEASGARIRTALGPYRSFAGQAATAQQEVAGLGLTSWQGEGGDAHRAEASRFATQVGQAHAAFDTAARALATLADVADSSAHRMSNVRSAASTAWSRMENLRVAALTASGAPSSLPMQQSFDTLLRGGNDLSRAEQDFLGLDLEAHTIRLGMRYAGDAAARSIRAVPAPPEIGRASVSRADVAGGAPPVVVRSGTLELSGGGALGNILAAKGLILKYEVLDNGRVRIHVVRSDTVGATTGVGAETTLKLGKYKLGAGVDLEAALSATLGEGIVVELDKKDFDAGVLPALLPWGAPGRGAVRLGRRLETSVEATAGGTVTLGPAEGKAELNGKATFTGDVYDDGGVDAAIAVEGDASAKAAAEVPGADGITEQLDKTGLGDDLGLPDTELAAEAAGAAILAMHINPGGKGGSLTVTTSRPLDEKSADGDDQVEEHKVTRVITPEEAAQISAAAARGDGAEVRRRMMDMARDVNPAERRSDPSVTDHKYVYSVDERGIEGSTKVSVGEKVEVDGKLNGTTKELQSIDGKPVR